MSMEMLKACVDGYSNRLLDMQLLSLQSGYWSGYYSRAKKPKTLKLIAETLMRKMGTSNNSKPKHAAEVDVDAFLEQERIFAERMSTLKL